MRTEVVEDIKQMKWEFFRASTHPDGKVPYALTSRLLSLEEAMIDHAPPKTFKALAERFLDENRIVPSEALLTPVSSDGSASCCDKSSTHSSQSPRLKLGFFTDDFVARFRSEEHPQRLYRKISPRNSLAEWAFNSKEIPALDSLVPVNQENFPVAR